MTVERERWLAESKKAQGRSHVEIKVNRGDILADNGKVLSTYTPEYKLFIDFAYTDPNNAKRQAKKQYEKDSLYRANASAIAEGLHKIMPDKSQQWFHDRLLQGLDSITPTGKRLRRWSLYPKNVTIVEISEIQKLPVFNRGKNFSGLYCDTFNTNRMPYGALASRTLGGVNAETSHGTSGLQHKYDSLLAGQSGWGHTIKTLDSYLSYTDKAPIPGANIHTTLNVNLQDYCESLLAQKIEEMGAINGTAIVLSVDSGDIKAMANIGHAKDGTLADVENYAVKQSLEPGSVFKTISLTAALDNGRIHITDRKDCRARQIKVADRTYHDDDSRAAKHSPISVPQVLGYSSNVGVIRLILESYGKSRNGHQQFCDDLAKCGITDNLELDFSGYPTVFLSSPETLKKRWSITAMSSLSIGYASLVTPINIVAFYNGLANKGRLMRPRLVSKITRDDEVIQTIPARAIREHMCSEQTAENVVKCLRWVVTDGLGSEANSNEYVTGGKTGTARISEPNHKGERLVSFVGYICDSNGRMKYTCMVCLRTHGTGSGGKTCAPIFKKIADYLMNAEKESNFADKRDSLHSIAPAIGATNLFYTNRLLDRYKYKLPKGWAPSSLIASQYGKISIKGEVAEITPFNADNNTMPDIAGMGLRDALYMLEKRGLKVKVHGIGRVMRQSIEPGTIYKKGEVIELALGFSHSFKEDEEVADSLAVNTNKDTEAKAPKKASTDTTKKQPTTPSNSPTKPEAPAPTPTKPKESAQPQEPTKPKHAAPNTTT